MRKPLQKDTSAARPSAIRYIGIYSHIPYCLSKCPYCDFNSAAQPANPRYMDALTGELELRINESAFINKKTRLLTIYFGGGTPSLIEPNKIKKFIERACAHFTVPPDIEITLEANPDTVDTDKLRRFRASGVTRLSLGAQSFSDKGLKTIGRRHTAAKTLRAYESARKAGFKNVSLDLIFALPGQDMRAWEVDVRQAIALSPEHISIYGLTLEKGTPLHEKAAVGSITLPDEDVQVAMYERGAKMLKKAGYARYEISNFAKKGFESRHNSLYWSGIPYIGLGAGAHSYLPDNAYGMRCWNEKNSARYIMAVNKKRLPVAGLEHLTQTEAADEALFTGLRLSKGIAIKAFEKRFKAHIDDFTDTKKLIAMGLLKIRNNKLMLTEKGILLSNEVFSTPPRVK